MRLLGAGAAAPLAAQMASWVHADPGDRPVRLMIFYVPHGWPIEHVDPGGQGNGFGNNGGFGGGSGFGGGTGGGPDRSASAL